MWGVFSLIYVCSVVSDSVQPVSLLCPWDSPGKNTGVGILDPPSLGDLPDPGLELLSPASPAVAGGFFTSVAPGKPSFIYDFFNFSVVSCIFF